MPCLPSHILSPFAIHPQKTGSGLPGPSRREWSLQSSWLDLNSCLLTMTIKYFLYRVWSYTAGKPNMPLLCMMESIHSMVETVAKIFNILFPLSFATRSPLHHQSMAVDKPFLLKKTFMWKHYHTAANTEKREMLYGSMDLCRIVLHVSQTVVYKFIFYKNRV